MKKGLLTLLAAALTIVGCQDYDSQFKELTTLVTQLSTDVAGLKTLSDDIDTLSQTVTGLASSIDVSSLQAQLDALEAALVGVADETDLTTLAEALALVQEDLKELLAANAVINQSITISNEATLQYAESLVGTGTDDPTVIVNGSVTVDSAFANADASLTARINAITNKIATILGVQDGAGLVLTHSASSTINFNELAFVDKTVEVSGSSYGHPKLTTISGNVTETHSGAISYPLLASAGIFAIGNDVTSVDFPTTANITSMSTVGSATGELWLKKATTINTGKSVISNLNATKATDITIGSGAHTGNVVINAPETATINHGVTSISGTLSVSSASSATIYFGSSLTSVGATTVGAIGQAHFPKITQFGGDASLGAKVLDLSGLTGNVSGTIVIPNALTVDTQKLVVTSNVTYTAATTAHFKTGSHTNINLPAVTTLELFKQGVVSYMDTRGYTTLKNFYVTGAQGKAPFSTTVTSVVIIGGPALTTAEVKGGDFDTVAVQSPLLTSLTTAGEIRYITIDTCPELEEIAMNHDHLSGSGAAEIEIVDNAKLKSLAPTALKYVGDITVEDNPSLTSLDLSSITKIPLAGSYEVGISGNKLTGTYVEATAGSTTTAFVEAQIKSDDLYSLMPLIDLAIASRADATIGNVTYTFDVNLSDTDALAVATDLDTAIPNVPVGQGTGFESKAADGIGVDTLFKLLVKAE